MSAYPYLPLFTRDFISDTTHLTAQETGAYLMLLMHAWQAPDCRLLCDDRKLAQWARVDAKTWRAIKVNVLEFWTLKDGYLSQQRLTKEHQNVAQLTDKRRAAAMKRWASHPHASAFHLHSKCNANGMHANANANPREEPSRWTATSDRGGVPNQGVHPGREGMREGESENPLDAWGDE